MSRIKLLVVVGAAGALVAACTSSNGTARSGASSSGPRAVSRSLSSPAPTSPHGSAAAGSSAAASASSSPSHPTPSALSGTWHGSYDGSFSGTFVLSWAQSGSNLSGTIRLSVSAAPLPIHGTVSGGSIHFGTVGSQAITYTGSVSGRSMSGNWEIAGGARGSGAWSADKT